MANEFGQFSLDFFSLKGKVAIVTGANQGLGMAYAVAFAKAGADIFVPHFTEDTNEIRSAVEAEGRRIAFLQGDLTDKSYIERIVESCLEQFGRIDILVNNAGASAFASFDDYPDKYWDMCINLDLNAVYFLSHAVAKVMKEQGNGKIINIGSALSYTADKHCPPYTVAKHGIIGLTRVFANELGEYNIQTNAISPGFLATEVNAELRKDTTFYDKITNRIPTGRWGEMEDLMGTVVYLASKASDYVNGWSISIDGGFTTTL
ncbi:2-deoxy-D-gluconate 3-dehydrogenase [Aequitasia blattaphilus]|uniref:SDR family oxidoreductase n=1 Tax=Aequitasia blattaphilus TaxID=2949332 RepID=A0ABT1EBY2_9FIRM|nr:SDR family oxidoreductase [Aequitasia blattaphilus]MCP1103335.1 SDR family oxidoreductase [Aequitasia blattaphilus]MCR8615975.1 SDR family oxidoreductase [Aequitasia blattaphilus]